MQDAIRRGGASGGEVRISKLNTMIGSKIGSGERSTYFKFEYSDREQDRDR